MTQQKKEQSMLGSIIHKYSEWLTPSTLIVLCITLFLGVRFQVWLQSYWSWGMVIESILFGSIGFWGSATTCVLWRMWRQRQQERER